MLTDAYPNDLTTDDNLGDSRYDSIVVHGAGVGDDGSITPVGRSRVDTALKLYRQGRSDTLIFSGSPVNRRAKTSEAESMRKYAIDNGIPETAIRTEESSRETVGNFLRVFQHYLHPENKRKNIFVTSSWHLPRARYVGGKVLPNGYEIKYVGSRDGMDEEVSGYAKAERRAMMIDRILLLGVRKGNYKSVGRRLGVFYKFLDLMERR